jgi:YD repeat-containing protein
MVTRLAPNPAKPLTPRAAKRAASQPAIVKPLRDRPAADATRVQKGGRMLGKGDTFGERVAQVLLKSPAVSKTRPAPVDSWWYKVKKAVAQVACNLWTPQLDTRTLSASSVPAGLEAKMKPGDVLVRRTEGTSGNLLIPSWWKHAAVYDGKGYVIEATFAGVKRTPLDEFFAHGDSVAVLSAPNLTDAQRAASVRYAESSVGKPYDFDVDFDDDARVTCTELAYHSLEAATGKPIVTKNWMDVVVGDNFFEKMDIVYNSAPTHGGAAK